MVLQELGSKLTEALRKLQSTTVSTHVSCGARSAHKLKQVWANGLSWLLLQVVDDEVLNQMLQVGL